MTRKEAFDEINKIQDEYIDELIALMNNTAYDSMKMLNFTSPTGTGKTKMMSKLIKRYSKSEYYFIITTLSKGQLHVQIRNNLEKDLVDYDNYYVYGSADFRVNSKLDAETLKGRIPEGSKCIWLRDEGHIRTNKWDEVLLDVCYKVINFSATNTHSDIQCNFTQTMMLRTVNQNPGTPEDAINKLLEVKKAHASVKNYNPCAIFRCVSGDTGLQKMIEDLCKLHKLKYIDITEETYNMQEICEDDNEYDVIINKFKIVEGIDIRRAHVLYMDNQPGNTATTIQVIGRCRRNALLYRNDIDILDSKNKKLLEATRECYVYYNVKEMKVDKDENGELQYAFCNYISCQTLKPHSIISVDNGQLENGLYIIELLNSTGKYSIEIDANTNYNCVSPLTDFYNKKISHSIDDIYIYDEGYKKCDKHRFKSFLLTTFGLHFNYSIGTYELHSINPYYNIYSKVSNIIDRIQIPEKILQYYKLHKKEYLIKLINAIKYIENETITNYRVLKVDKIKDTQYAPIIDIIWNSKLSNDIKIYYINILNSKYENSDFEHIDFINTHEPYTSNNSIYIENLINEFLLYTENIKLVKQYIQLCSLDVLLGIKAPEVNIDTILKRIPIFNADYYNKIRLNATYDGTTDNYVINTIIDTTIIDTFIELLVKKINTTYFSLKNKNSIILAINQLIDSIENSLITGQCFIIIDFSKLFEKCIDEEIFLARNKYYLYTLHPNEISPYSSYNVQTNDIESSIVGVDLMKQIKNGNTTEWIESRSVSSKVGNYNKFNSFISNKYKNELIQASTQYCTGKNEFKLDKKCNTVIGYCVEYYSKYLIYGEDYLGQHLTRAMRESTTSNNDAVVIRACMFKYKEMMGRSFGQGMSKLIKTISIDKLIQEKYNDFIILVKTLGFRVAEFVKNELYHNELPINNIDPNLSIRHIAGLADYITEDTILDVKVNGNLNEGQVRQVLAYQYLSTKRSDLNIKRVIVYDATSGKHINIDIAPENWKENQPYGYKDTMI